MTLTFPVPPASLTLIDADGIELEETAGVIVMMSVKILLWR